MQVFVKFPTGGSIIVDAEPGDSVLAVIRRAGLKHAFSPQLEAGILVPGKVTLGGKSIANLDLTLGDLNVQKESTFLVALGPRGGGGFVPDAVHGKLQAFLRAAPADLGPGEITFIGIGSYDHAHGDASIKRQQCPDALLKFCMESRVDLNIVLVDPGFGDGASAYRQIYDFPGWLPLLSEDDGKTRHFMYAPATAARACDIWLTVFATKIAEYTGSLDGRGMVVAGVPIGDVFSAVIERTDPDACLICGNFYQEPTDPSQYVTLGSRALIERAGFVYNP